MPVGQSQSPSRSQHSRQQVHHHHVALGALQEIAVNDEAVLEAFVLLHVGKMFLLHMSGIKRIRLGKKISSVNPLDSTTSCSTSYSWTSLGNSSSFSAISCTLNIVELEELDESVSSRAILSHGLDVTAYLLGRIQKDNCCVRSKRLAY